MKLLFMALLILMLFSAAAFSQSLRLDITYTRSENDLNRSKRTEIFSIYGKSASYSLEYEGKVMPGEMNRLKECELTDYSYEQIIKSITNNSVNVNESVYRKERLDGEGIFYLMLSVGLVLDGTPYSIVLDGEANLVMDNKVYLRVINFIKELRKIVDEC